MATAPLAKAPSPPTAPSGADSPAASPLGVALDGALLRTDTLHEALLWLVRHRPAQALWLLLAAFRGPAFLRRQATALASLDPQTLPLDDDLVADLRRQRAAGRRLVLCSSADGELVEAVAARVGLFDRAVGGDQPAAAAAATAPPLEARFRPARGGLRTWVRALRLHQWSKNTLLFVPLGLAGPLASAADYAAGLLGFLVFGLLASAGYLVNDLLDLEADRRHRSKRHRPFAAGDLSPGAGVAAAALLLLAAAGFCALLPGGFAAVACAYLVGTLAYSLRLKRVPLLDVLMLAGLFTVRILAGAMLTPTPLSFWLLTFSMFLFLSLALVKRYTELSEAAAADDGAAMLASRGYDQRDLPLILPLGLGSALAAATIFVIYLVDEKFPTEIYRRPEYLWLVFPILLFWLMRVWRLAVHGRMHDDPVLFALKDRLSLALGGVIGVLLTLAW